MTLRSENSPGVYTYAEERRALLVEDNERLKRWATPLIEKGYRFGELKQVRQAMQDTEEFQWNGATRLVALGMTKVVSPRRLWWRRQWRKLFVYGCLDIQVGGGWRFWA